MAQVHQVVYHVDGDQFWLEFPDFPEAATYGTIGRENPVTLASDCLLAAIRFRADDGGGAADTEFFMRFTPAGEADRRLEEYLLVPPLHLTAA